MNVLFIYFNNEFRPRVPFSLSLLETIVQLRGHKTAVFDTSFYQAYIDPSEKNLLQAGIWKGVENLSISPKQSDPYDDLKKKIETFKPDLIGFSYYATNQAIQEKLLAPLKREFPNLPIIAGGVQVCLNPKAALAEPYIDMICYGEGEDLLPDLCDAFGNGTAWQSIQGLWFKQNGTIVCNGIAPLADINSNPVPNFDSYEPLQIHGLYEGRAYRMGHIETTRGCPYNCTYCGAGTVRKVYADAGEHNYVRHKSPVKIVRECRELKEKYQLEMFYFQDGTFTCKPLLDLEKLAYLYREQVGLPFIALVRPETISPKCAELLGIMNCKHVSIGVESGNEEYRRNILNRSMSNQQIIDAVRLLRAQNINVSAYNMIGLPGMDRKHVFETIRLNKMAEPNSSIVSVFIPFPDNTLTCSLVSKGLIRQEDIVVGSGAAPTVDIKDMGRDEIAGLLAAFNLYVRLPEFMYPLISLLEKRTYLTDFLRRVFYRLIR